MYNLEYDRVNDLFAECAYPIGEKPNGPDIIVDSISGVQFIYRKKFQKHLPEVGKMIDDLPDEFFDLSGPFSLLATRRDGTMWTGEPMVMEKFLILAMAAGLAKFTLPRSAWKFLPNQLPYIHFDHYEAGGK